jgi:branched-chain amino acid transport system substrate-binding protein
MQNAVDLAVQQNASLGNGYTLSAINVDEANGFMDQAVGTLAANDQTMGIVGPLDSSDALAMLPGIEASGLTTISPSATLPGLTQSDQASTEGLDFATLHPTGKPVAFFRLPETDNAAGKAAADLALSASAPGLAAHAVFLVDDGTASGKAEVAAFKSELGAKRGTVAGQASMTLGTQGNVQSIVSAIVEAYPDLVFFGGSIDVGTQLRSTLSLSGAPQMVILTVGPIGDDPTWGAAVGVTAAAAYTTALLPARDLSKLPNSKEFLTAYHTAFPGAASSLPQSALAYDAAMDEISAIKSLISAGKPVTRAGVLAAVTSAHYPGITGTIAFDKNGDNTSAIGFSVYTCDTKGNWRYQASLSGNG